MMDRMILEHYGCPDPGRLTVRQFIARINKIHRLRRKLAGDRESHDDQIADQRELGFEDE